MSTIRAEIVVALAQPAEHRIVDPFGLRLWPERGSRTGKGGIDRDAPRLGRADRADPAASGLATHATESERQAQEGHLRGGVHLYARTFGYPDLALERGREAYEAGHHAFGPFRARPDQDSEPSVPWKSSDFGRDVRSRTLCYEGWMTRRRPAAAMARRSS
jgi:hypothetical protein